MPFTKFLLCFFLIFFSLQLFLGEAGIVALILEKRSTTLLYENINTLIDINEKLNTQVQLTRYNKSYLLMNAHRVGLIAPDEFLIKIEKPLFSGSVVYSPGTIILEKQAFSFTNLLLFLLSILVLCWVFAYKILKKSMGYFERKPSKSETLLNDEYSELLHSSITQEETYQSNRNI